jgi:1-deoxy-D-xylulose-5-phosphate synthase
LLVTVEEGAIGGFGAHVMHLAAHEGWLSECQILPLCLPDVFIEHGNPKAQYDEAGLNAEQIIEAVRARMANKPMLVKKHA